MGTTVLPDDIQSYVVRHFAPAEQSAALSLLSGATQPGGEAADARMLRCALFNCRNKLATLQFDIDWLASDSRDVIMNAEYERQNGAWVQVRDLSQPFPQEA